MELMGYWDYINIIPQMISFEEFHKDPLPNPIPCRWSVDRSQGHAQTAFGAVSAQALAILAQVEELGNTAWAVERSELTHPKMVVWPRNIGDLSKNNVVT